MDRLHLALVCAVLSVAACACHGVFEQSQSSLYRTKDAGGPSYPPDTGNPNHPPDAGAVATCGDGRIESGEACEGSNLNNSNCTSLGFQSGTLACAASCQFDTSGCVGGLTLTVTASRTSCVAPCGVSFDATGTTGLQNGDYVGANFNWDFDHMNTDPTGLHRTTIGFVAAHVYDLPGTYQVMTRVRDLAGHAGTASTTITVSPMSGTTYYVASNGSDSNTGTSMTKPFATVAAALKHAGANVTVLMRRGDTFNAGSTETNISTTGPFLLGAYTDAGSSATAAPIISSSASGSSGGAFGISGSDIRLTDVHIVATQGAVSGVALNNAPNTLLERVETEGVGSSSTVGCISWQIDMGSPSSSIVDSHAHDFYGYGVYADRPSGFALIGTTIDKFKGTDHGVRIQGGSVPGGAGFANDTYIAEDTIAPNTASGSAFDAMVIRGDNTNTVIANNTFEDNISFDVTNSMELEHVQLILAEGNTLSKNQSPSDPSYESIHIQAQHVVIRNNIMINPGIAINIDTSPMLPANYVDQIYAYNNTAYMQPPSDVPAADSFYFLKRGTTTGTVTLRDNVWSQGGTNPANALVQTDGLGTTIEDHNLAYAPNVSGTWAGKPTGAGDVTGDPQFVSTALNSLNLQLTSGSPAIDVGAMTPAYQDFSGVVTRPQGAGWDLGAFEFVQSSGSQNTATGSQDASVSAASAAVWGPAAPATGRKVNARPSASR